MGKIYDSNYFPVQPRDYAEAERLKMLARVACMDRMAVMAGRVGALAFAAAVIVAVVGGVR